VSISITQRSIEREIKKVLSSTFLFSNDGNTRTIRVGKMNQSDECIVENIVDGLQNAICKYLKGWKNVQSIQLRTIESIALPIFNSLPEVISRISIAPKEPHQEKEDKEENEEKEENKENEEDEENEEDKEEVQVETKTSKKKKPTKLVQTSKKQKKLKKNS